MKSIIYLTAKARVPALSTQAEVDKARKYDELAMQAKAENMQRAKHCDRISPGRKANGDRHQSSTHKSD